MSEIIDPRTAVDEEGNVVPLEDVLNEHDPQGRWEAVGAANLERYMAYLAARKSGVTIDPESSESSKDKDKGFFCGDCCRYVGPGDNCPHADVGPRGGVRLKY